MVFFFLGMTGIPGVTPEMESQMLEYFKVITATAEMQRINAAVNSSPMINRQGSTSPLSKSSPPDVRGLPLWNLYNNNNIYNGFQQTPMSPVAPNSPEQESNPEPQREALDLGLRTSPTSTVQRPPSVPHTLQVKKDRDLMRKSHKRSHSDDENITETPSTSIPGTHIKITNGQNGESSLVVSMELNGIVYEGVLMAQTDRRANNNSTNTRGNLNGY